MDLIITFHIGGMKRAVGYAPAALDGFFGTSAWRTAFEQSQQEGRREGSRILLDCYEEQLRSIGYQWFGDAVRVTNSRHLGLYHLIFASKSERGEDFWQKITYRSPGGQLPLIREEPSPYLA
jgi:three-Cys-motif partner protein